MDDNTDLGPDAYENDELRQELPEPETIIVDTPEQAAELYVRNAGQEGTVTNYVVYGAEADLSRAQNLFARNRIAEGVEAMRTVVDTVEANRDGVHYLSSLHGELGKDVDDIADRANALLSGSFLNGSVVVDGAEMSLRQLLFDPEGANAIRSHRLKTELGLDPRFVDEYLSDDTAPEKRDAIDKVLTKFLPYVVDNDPKRPRTVPAMMQSAQARTYAGALMDMWDDKPTADGGTVPGLGTVFGSGAAQLMGALLESNQNQAVGPGVLRALTAIYGRDMREGESGYTRAARAASDYLSLKNSVMKKSSYERTPLGVVVQTDVGDGREELFSAIVADLADAGAGRLDLGSQYARDVFKELFDVYDAAKEKGLDLVRIFRGSSVGPFSKHAAKTVAEAVAGGDPAGALSASSSPIGTLKRMTSSFDVRILGSDVPSGFDELDIASGKTAASRFRAEKDAAEARAPVCSLMAEDVRTAIAESLLPEALSRSVDVTSLLHDEMAASDEAGEPTAVVANAVRAVANRLRPYFPPGTEDALGAVAEGVVTDFAKTGRAVVANVVAGLLRDTPRPTASEDDAEYKALAKWAEANVSRASLLAPEIKNLVTKLRNVEGMSRREAVARAVMHVNWLADDDVEVARRKLDAMCRTAPKYEETGSGADARITETPDGQYVDELAADPAKMARYARLRDLYREQQNVDRRVNRQLELLRGKMRVAEDFNNEGGMPPAG